jgi:hypothetical protein
MHGARVWPTRRILAKSAIHDLHSYSVTITWLKPWVGLVLIMDRGSVSGCESFRIDRFPTLFNFRLP